MKKGFAENLCREMNEMDAELSEGPMTHYEFTPKKWMIFDLQNGNTAIGYTQIKDSQPVIVYTSDAGESGVLPFDKIINPRRLYIESRTANDIRQSVTTLPDAYINYIKGKA